MVSAWAFVVGAGDGNRTRVASLEDWGSTIELRPRAPRCLVSRASRLATCVAYRLPRAVRAEAFGATASEAKAT